MSVDVLSEQGLGRFLPTVERLADWAGQRDHAPPQLRPQPAGATGWMDRLSWALGDSFITCCLALSWVEYRPTAEGMDVHLVFDPDCLPERLVVSSGDGEGDARLMRRPIPGATYVFDEACANDSLLEAIDLVGAFFISPLARDAVFRMIKVVPATGRSRRYGGFGDWLIELHGSSQERRSGLSCRLTTHLTGQGLVHHLITNRFDLRGPVVFGIYKHRREIASFLEHVRCSPAQRFLLGSSKGVSPLRLFGSLLLLRVWQRITGHVHRGQQEVSNAVEELSRDVLGLLPRNEIIHYPPRPQHIHPSALGLKQEERLTASLLQSPRAMVRDVELAHG